MRRLETLLRGAGSACLLMTIVLCQTVLAHNDPRPGPDRRHKGRRVIHHYELVRVQKVAPDLSEYTYRAWLWNMGDPLAGATARLANVPRSTTVVDDSLTFGPVKSGRAVRSSDTFSVRRRRHHPFNPLWPDLGWAIVPLTAGGTNRAPNANAGPDRSAAIGARVVLDGSGSADPDLDPIRYSWTLTRPIGSTTTLSSPTAMSPSFVPDRRGTYEARLVVDDGVLPSAPDSAVITVSNSAPIANAGPDQMALVTRVVTLDGSASSDGDGDALSYQWSFVTRPAGSAAMFSDPAAESPTFLVDRPGTYTARLVVNDGASASAADTVTVVTINTAPVANAGPDQTAAVGQTATLNGSGSSDADGDALTYSWSLQSRPAGSSAVVTGANLVTPSLTIDRAGSYVARLLVGDGRSSTSVTSDTVTISTVNSAPVANAGADQTAFVAQAVTLNGDGSSDVDGDAVTFSWTFVSRPAGSAAVLSGAASVRPTFAVDRPGSYQVRLIVNDGALSSIADVVDIQTVNSAPVANAGSDQAGYVGQSVMLDGSASTDVDGNALSYVWSLTSRPAGSTAAIADPTAVMPTFALDRTGVYVAQLIVNDATVSSVADTVTVTTRNSVPVANAGADVATVARRTVSLAGDGSSDADGDALSFSWALIQRPAGSGAVLARATGALTSFVADRPGTYIAQLIVNDGFGDSAPDTVTIATGNTLPVANAGADIAGVVAGDVAALDGTGSVDADGHALSYRWSLLSVPAGSVASLSDAAVSSPWFAMDRAGQYVAQLIVNDGFGDSAPDTVVVTASNRGPFADAGSDQSVFLGAGASLTAAASSDPDGDALTYQWSFASRPAGSAAALAGGTSAVASFTPDVVGDYTVSLTVTDPAGTTASDTVVVSVYTPASVTVTARDASASETGPDAGSFTFTRTGSTVRALVVQYRVAGSATNGADYTALSGAITIPAGQASVVVAVAPVDDAEAEGAETVDVTVQPGGAYTVGSPATAAVVIADNDRPVVTIVATDPLAAERPADSGMFTITRTGPTTDSLWVSFSPIGTAQSGVDYVSLGLQVTIPAGASSVTLTVTPLADAESEGPENVDVFLTPNPGVTVGTPGSARVVIAAN